MCGKLFLLTLLCASFVQVWGATEKDEKIKEAIREVDKITYRLYWDTNDFSLYSGFMLVKYKTKTEKYLKEANEESHNLRNFLQETASFLKEEAKASNKPQSVFSCIDRVRDKSSEKVEKLTTKHRSEIVAAGQLFENEGKKIKTTSLIPFNTVGYERNTYKVRIASSKQIKDVDYAVKYYRDWWRPTVYNFLEKLRQDLFLLVENYNAKVNASFRVYEPYMRIVKNQSAAEMRKCLHTKQGISGQSTFLNLIDMQ